MFRMKQPSTACLPTRAVTLMEEAWGSMRSCPVWLKVAWVPPGLSPLGTEPESQPEPANTIINVAKDLLSQLPSLLTIFLFSFAFLFSVTLSEV